MDDVLRNTITAREQAEIDAANASGRTPVVFVHGLWLHASSWDPWADYFREAGFAPLRPGWPGDGETVEATRAHPESLAGVGVNDATHHYASIIRQLEIPPLIVGHSFGGLIAEKLLGMNLGYAAVAIDAAPFRGVLPVPISAVRSSFPVLGNPANIRKTVALTPKQFRYAFTNALDDAEADALYDKYAIPAPGRPLFQAVTANLDPNSEASVDYKNKHRGGLLLISGTKDNTVPFAISNAAYKRQHSHNPHTEIKTFDNRGHSLTIDHGWRELADYILEFAARSTPSATTSMPS